MPIFLPPAYVRAGLWTCSSCVSVTGLRRVSSSTVSATLPPMADLPRAPGSAVYDGAVRWAQG